MDYSLNLTADVNRPNGFFEDADGSRVWMKLVNGTWQPANGTVSGSNPDNGYFPTLTVNQDSLQIRVFFVNELQPINASAVNICVLFARLRRTGVPRFTASPFGQANDINRWVQTIFGVNQTPSVDPIAQCFFLPLGVPTVVLPPAAGRLPFEFSVAVTLTRGTDSGGNNIYVEYSYDPELDVEVNTK